MPIWAYGILLIALISLLALTVFRSPDASPTLKPNVISLEQALAQLPLDTDVAEATLAEVETGRLSIVSIKIATSTYYHQTSSEIAYVLAGQGKAISNDSEFELAVGKMLIVFAGTPMRWEPSGDQPLELLLFSTPRPTEQDVLSVESPDRPLPAAALMPMVIDVGERMAQGLEQSGGLEFTIIAQIEPTGSVELCRVKENVDMQHYPKENHMLYVFRGHAKVTLGSSIVTVGPGQIVIIPAGVKHNWERIGEEPVEFVLFSTPWDARD